MNSQNAQNIIFRLLLVVVVLQFKKKNGTNYGAIASNIKRSLTAYLFQLLSRLATISNGCNTAAIWQVGTECAGTSR